MCLQSEGGKARALKIREDIINSKNLRIKRCKNCKSKYKIHKYLESTSYYCSEICKDDMNYKRALDRKASSIKTYLQKIREEKKIGKNCYVKNCLRCLKEIKRHNTEDEKIFCSSVCRSKYNHDGLFNAMKSKLTSLGINIEDVYEEK